MRVLFIGNSYTFYNDVPAQVVALAEEARVRLDAETIAEGGANVELHFTSTGARRRLEAGGLDRVVIQDQSGGPLHDRARFDRFAPELGRRAIAAGAELVWYATWARAKGHAAYRESWSGGSPAMMTRAVRAAYDGIAACVGGIVAPVGDAWQLAIDEGLPFSLHDTDGHHASPHGSHLAALVLAAEIAHIDPAAARYLPDGVTEPEAIPLRDVARRTCGGQS